MSQDEIIRVLLARVPKPPLFPKEAWREDLSPEIKKVQKTLVRAALYCWNDELEKCHVLVQEDKSPEASLWHAILHRREFDFSNSQYWYREAGPHRLFQEVKKRVPDWDPIAFVEKVRDLKKEEESLAYVQAQEMEVLLNHCLSHK